MLLSLKPRPTCSKEAVARPARLRGSHAPGAVTWTLLAVLALGAIDWNQPLLASSTGASDAPLPADVVSVAVTGAPGDYNFSVGIESPDTGCEQYADWWEVITVTGELVYRRTLAHSHVDEQPFVRSGGPVEVTANTEVWVRAHMFSSGYGGRVFRGSVEAGFQAALPPTVLAPWLENEPPEPPACAF